MLQSPSRKNCRARSQKSKSINSQVQLGPWSLKEDQLLISLVESNGPSRWNYISSFLPGRIGKQCRERWCNHLSPYINKSSWSEEEELILYILHNRLGNKWSMISRELHGRTDNTIKNHWNSAMKKKLDHLQMKYNSILNNSVNLNDREKEEDELIEKMKKIVNEQMEKVNEEKRKAYEKFKKMKIENNPNSNTLINNSSKLRKVLGFRTHSKKNRRKSKKKSIQRQSINLLKTKQKENDIPLDDTDQNIKPLSDTHSAFKNYTYEFNQTPFQKRFNNFLFFSQLQTTTNSQFTFPVHTKPIQIICNNNINYFFANAQPVKKNLDELFRQTLNYHNK